MQNGGLGLKIATLLTGHRSAGKIETKDRKGREGFMAIFSELKIAGFPGLCVVSLSINIKQYEYPTDNTNICQLTNATKNWEIRQYTLQKF